MYAYWSSSIFSGVIAKKRFQFSIAIPVVEIRFCDALPWKEKLNSVLLPKHITYIILASVRPCLINPLTVSQYCLLVY